MAGVGVAGLASDKTFHLKWNNHLQNLSQLFTGILGSCALADVTLSCRDGSLKAHRLVLSACSPYFEQIFRDNPCQHPVVILKGIPYAEIKLLVEFMYKGSVDVQELDLQSLMHTACELEVRGLAYEARDAPQPQQLLNVNLNELPTPYMPTQTPLSHAAHTSHAAHASHAALASHAPHPDHERLKQIHMYQQQSMVRAEEARRRRRADESAAVNTILAAAARELDHQRPGAGTGTATGQHMHHAQRTTQHEGVGVSGGAGDEGAKVKKRVSFAGVGDEPERNHKQDHATHTMRVTGVSSAEGKPGIKVVNIAALQHRGIKRSREDGSEEDGEAEGAEGEGEGGDEDESSEGEGEGEDAEGEDGDEGDADSRPHCCDICDLRFSRSSHLSRHRLTHTGERPYTCGGCGRSFARTDKLRLHTKICEKEDPTVEVRGGEGGDEEGGAGGGGGARSGEVGVGTVRATHKDSPHLMFTPSGDVMLAPGTVRNHLDLEGGEQVRRGRGRPRKTPLPETPKIKKKRGRPPKNSLEGDGSYVGTPSPLSGGVLAGLGLQAVSVGAGGVGAGGVGAAMGAVPQQLALLPDGREVVVKRRRGRPPKNYYTHANIEGGVKENYNASNLPFGDFSYLTDMMYGGALYGGSVGVGLQLAAGGAAGGYLQLTRAPPQPAPRLPPPVVTAQLAPAPMPAPRIDLSSSDDEAPQHTEADDNVGAHTEIMTVGECQIVKVAANGEEHPATSPPPASAPAPPTVSHAPSPAPTTAPAPVAPTAPTLTIRPVPALQDCTIQPLSPTLTHADTDT